MLSWNASAERLRRHQPRWVRFPRLGVRPCHSSARARREGSRSTLECWNRCKNPTVRVEDVGGVVTGVVLGPLARGAVVAEAGLEGGAVELLDRRAVAGREREVHVLGHGLVGHERERALATRDVEAVGGALVHAQPDRRRDGLVEEPRLDEVADADPEVVDPVLPGPRLAVVDGLDAVAVGVADEGAVVVRRVLRPRAGRAVVLVAGPGHRSPP